MIATVTVQAFVVICRSKYAYAWNGTKHHAPHYSQMNEYALFPLLGDCYNYCVQQLFLGFQLFYSVNKWAIANEMALNCRELECPTTHVGAVHQ